MLSPKGLNFSFQFWVKTDASDVIECLGIDYRFWLMDWNSIGVLKYEQQAKDGSDRDKMAASIRNVLVSYSWIINFLEKNSKIYF